LREDVDHALVTVCPGIRPVENDDDQERVVSPGQAIRNGADYLVVGRPIRDAKSPSEAAELIQAQILQALPS